MSFSILASWVAEREPWQSCRLHRVDTGLSVEIIEHAVATAHGPRTATSYLTRGLTTDVVVTWCGPRVVETPSAEIIAALRQVRRAGVVPRVGDTFALGEGSLMEGVGLSALLFVPARELAGLRPPPGTLHAIGITTAELALIARVGAHRVLARLGVRYRTFPWPVFTTARHSVGRADEDSVVDSLRRIVVPGLTVALDGARLAVRVPGASRPALAEAIADPPEHGVVLPATPDPDIDRLLLWDPERCQTRAVSGPRTTGRRTGGAFVRVVAGGPRPCLIAEDGFVVTQDALRQACC